jgi:hypothetical protein
MIVPLPSKASRWGFGGEPGIFAKKHPAAEMSLYGGELMN